MEAEIFTSSLKRMAWFPRDPCEPVWLCQEVAGMATFSKTLSCEQVRLNEICKNINIKYASRSSAQASGLNLDEWLMCCFGGKQPDWSLITISAPLAINTHKEPNHGLRHTLGLNWEWRHEVCMCECVCVCVIQVRRFRSWCFQIRPSIVWKLDDGVGEWVQVSCYT